MKIALALLAILALVAAAPSLDRWVVNATGITVPTSADGKDAVYEVVGVTNTDADANTTCDLHVDNHGNEADGATITMTDPSPPFVIRSGDTLTATGNAACVLVLAVFSGYSAGVHPVAQHT